MASSEKKRIRRTPEQMIADLEAQIAAVVARAKAKQIKKSPAAKAALSAVRALDKGLEAAAEEGNGLLSHALADARKPLSEYCESQGLRLPKPRLPRGRRPGS